MPANGLKGFGVKGAFFKDVHQSGASRQVLPAARHPGVATAC